jgi:hypothetical protein
MASEEARLDSSLVVACAELVGRAGAREFQIGYLGDDDDPQWWAHASYGGDRLMVDNHPTPGAAAYALALKILAGGKCRCGRLVALSDGGAMAYDNVRMADGSRWSIEEAQRAGQCRWRLVDTPDPTLPKRWEPSCPGPNRAQRRARKP